MDAHIKRIAALLLATGLFAPNFLARQDYRGLGQQLQIHLDKGSPAYAAWEDTQTHQLKEILISGAKEIQDGEKSDMQALLVGKKLRRELAVASSKSIDVVDLRRLSPIIVEIEPQEKTRPASILSYQSFAQKLVSQELERRASETPGLRLISTVKGDVIEVRGPVPTAATAEIGTKSIVDEDTPYAYLKNLNEKNGNQKSALAPKRERLIAGNIYFGGGAALFSPSHEIRAVHRIGDKIYREGRVSTSDGRYSIKTDTTEGEIYAEVISATGELIAMGSKSLLSVPAKALSSAGASMVDVELRPVEDAFIARVISATQEPRRPIEESRLLITGLERFVTMNKKEKLWRDDSFAANSQFMIRAEEAKHKTTVGWIEGGRVANIRLYPISYVRALMDIVLGKNRDADIDNKAIVWGKISSQGFPVAGAKASFVGEDHSAIYFNGFIPDKNQEMTSKTGDFVFVGVESEEKMVQVELLSQPIWPYMISTFHQTITQADVDIGEPRNIGIRSFDVFSGEPVESIYSALGSKNVSSVGPDGYGLERAQITNGLTFIEADADASYLPIRTQVKFEQTEVHLPQLKLEWMNKIITEAKIPDQQSGRRLVGLVTGDDFEVVLNAEFVKEGIVFFDEGGNITKAGQNGGGFIIFGLGNGLHTVGIIPSRSKMIQTQTVYIDGLSAHLARFNLFL